MDDLISRKSDLISTKGSIDDEGAYDESRNNYELRNNAGIREEKFEGNGFKDSEGWEINNVDPDDVELQDHDFNTGYWNAFRNYYTNLAKP